MIDPGLSQISVRRQCQLIGLHRSVLYYEPARERAFTLELMRLIDQQYPRTPFYGRLRMTAYLRHLGCEVNHKRVQRLMRKMGLEAIYPKPRTNQAARAPKVYPYLLKGGAITRPNQVWSTDLTYIPMERGFMYLGAIMDWDSRYVLSWKLSNTLDMAFCLEALEEAFCLGRPEIFNSAQGAQFTSVVFTDRLEAEGIKISMDGRGRCLDNVFIERVWRAVKYEDVYIKNYATVVALEEGLTEYFRLYNDERPHQSLQYKTPVQIHFAGVLVIDGRTKVEAGSK
jgi:putative transposase